MLDKVVPHEVQKAAMPLIRQVCSTGQNVTVSDIPYEGFLETRGRTYWRVSFELSTNSKFNVPYEGQVDSNTHNLEHTLLIIIEDATNLVRSRLHLNAIHHISSAILGRFALPQVLDYVLQAVQELVGSTRCAIVLIDQAISNGKLRTSDFEEHAQDKTDIRNESVPTVTVAAQKGLHLSSQNWHPQMSEQLLLGQVLHSRRSLVIPDTNAWPDMEFPLLDDQGIPRRPGSVLCVPIFEPDPTSSSDKSSAPGSSYE